MAPIRVLQVMPAMDAGGMETFVMNVYRTIDREKVQFDFLYHYDKPCFYDYEITSLGGRITKLTVRQDNNVPKYLGDLRRLFREHPEYRILHGHYSGFGMFYNKEARKCGVPVRVGHSHNTAYERNLVGTLDKMMSGRFDKELTDRFACSQLAGEMLFGTSPFTVLPNGIVTDLFAKRDPDRRAQLREQLGIRRDEIVFGHVGRFTDQKNHEGLLRIFAALRKKMPRARLLMLGGGPEDYVERIKALARELQLGDSAIFAGVRSNVQSFYDAMDAFLLPSLFEGLPVVLVEAQSSGLPCFVSDTVDKGSAFAKNIRFLPLNEPDVWAESIAHASLARDPNAQKAAIKAGYDIQYSAEKLQEFYLRRYAEVTT